MDGSSRFDPHSAVPAKPCADVTPLSEGALLRRARSAQRVAALRHAGRVIGALARASLVLGSLAMTTGCLITDPPQFKPAKHTRPFLANPDPAPGVVTVDSTLIQTTDNVIRFGADVFSQDDPLDPSAPSEFENVYAVLYIDYGLQADDSQPYRYAFSKSRPLDPGTIDQTGRRVTIEWHPDKQKVDPGCHTATLMVSHIFDDIPCPACPDDVASITWPILRCSTSDQTCNELPVTGANSCEGLDLNACKNARKAQGNEALACPDITDGGTMQ